MRNLHGPKMRNSPRVGQWATMYTLTKTGWASLDAHPVQPRRSATSFRLLLLLATNHRHGAEPARAQKRERARLRRRDAVPVNENAVRTSVALDRQVEDVVSARVQTVSSSQIEDLCPVATIWSGWRRIDRDRMPVERSADPVIVEGKHVEADRHCVRGHRESRLEDVLVVRIFVGSAIPYRCRRIDADVLRAVARRNSLPAAWRCRYNCGRIQYRRPNRAIRLARQVRDLGARHLPAQIRTSARHVRPRWLEPLCSRCGRSERHRRTGQSG